MNKKQKFKVHVHLANLIKTKFGLFLEIEHLKFAGNGSIQAVTMVSAYKSIEDARNMTNCVASAYAECSHKDQFVRAKGLEIALRRLYRKLAQS